MRAYVLTDPRLAKLAGRFVWLDVDTEKPGNAGFVAKFPIDAWPTLLAVDPGTERVLVRWAGTATAEEIERLARDAERSLRAASEAGEPLARADRLMGERRHAEAAVAYREALAKGPPPAARERASEALVQALAFAGDRSACAAAAREALPRAGPAGAARVAAQGLDCALGVEGARARDAALAELEPAARRALSASGVLADDRSWLYDELAKVREARGDAAGARRLARRWLEFLDGEASRATSPAERSAFDGQRLEAAVRAGEPARMLPALVRSERDLPGEYVPPSNLASLYLALGRPEDALAAADRALARADGPRRIRVQVLRAQAQAARGDRDGARATLALALQEGGALPESARPRGWMAKAQKLYDGLAAEN